MTVPPTKCGFCRAKGCADAKRRLFFPASAGFVTNSVRNFVR